MGERLVDHGEMLDGGATALGALLDVDLEPSFEQPGPAHGGGATAGGASALVR
jgi:hypothetical protein